MPITLIPASDRRRISGSPTYPSPMTPTVAFRFFNASINSSRQRVPRPMLPGLADAEPRRPAGAPQLARESVPDSREVAQPEPPRASEEDKHAPIIGALLIALEKHASQQCPGALTFNGADSGRR